MFSLDKNILFIDNSTLFLLYYQQKKLILFFSMFSGVLYFIKGFNLISHKNRLFLFCVKIDRPQFSGINIIRFSVLHFHTVIPICKQKINIIIFRFLLFFCLDLFVVSIAGLLSQTSLKLISPTTIKKFIHVYREQILQNLR